MFFYVLSVLGTLWRHYLSIFLPNFTKFLLKRLTLVSSIYSKEKVVRIYLINPFVCVGLLTGCGGSNVIDTKKPVSSRVSDTDLIFHCRKPDFLSAHPSYSRELDKRGLRDRCYDNPKVKKEVDEELEKKRNGKQN